MRCDQCGRRLATAREFREVEDGDAEGQDGNDLLELGEAHVAAETEVSPVHAPQSDAASDEGTLPPPPRIASGGGGTLFERMSNLSRGLNRNDDKEDDDAEGGINIPRFLDRQSNN